MRIFLCLAALVAATNTFGVESGEYRYTFLTVGEKSGAQSVNYDGAGHVAIDFEFNDRGRGPKTTTRLELNADGKDAHMFIVDGDPLADMANLYRVGQVIKGRRLYFAPDLLEAQGFAPFSD